jgi:hypothetical protein
MAAIVLRGCHAAGEWAKKLVGRHAGPAGSVSPWMAHDEHFLRRLDRVQRGDQLDYLLGLYRDHEFVRYLLTHVKLPPDADRVALAVEDSGDGPHAVVARDGGFVTCLGAGMRTGALPVVTRAHVQALAAKLERVRDGLALARTRGLDAKRAVSRLESAGLSLSREDFVATAALLGPATTVLTETYAGCVADIVETMPLLMQRDLDAKLRHDWTREAAAKTWGMAHAAVMHLDNAPRDWVEQWAELPAHAKGSPFLPLLRTFEVPFVARAAWIAGRLGKPFLPFYRQRYAAGADGLNFVEAGWGLVAMAARHASLRGDAVRALQAPPAPDAPDNLYTRVVREQLAGLADAIGGPEEAKLVESVTTLGRTEVEKRTAGLADDSPYAFRDPALVPEDLALAMFLQIPLDAFDPTNGTAFVTAAVLSCARLPAEQLYLPAAFLHAVGREDLGECGARLVERHRTYLVSPPVRRETPRVGRNEPCPCGSGKKHKKCCGG